MKVFGEHIHKMIPGVFIVSFVILGSFCKRLVHHNTII